MVEVCCRLRPVIPGLDDVFDATCSIEAVAEDKQVRVHPSETLTKSSKEFQFSHVFGERESTEVASPLTWWFRGRTHCAHVLGNCILQRHKKHAVLS